MKKSAIVVWLSCCIFLLGGCSNTGNDIDTVRIGCFPNVTHSQALLNKANSNFQNELGDVISVEWKYFNSGNPEIEAFFAEELDIGFIGPIPAINGNIKSNGDLVIIAGATNSGAILIARKDLEIKSVIDLANKKVAVPSFGNTQDFMLKMMLEENNLSDVANGGNVEIIPVKNPDLKNYFVQGNIDAAFVPEPWASQLIYEDVAKIVLDVDKTWNKGQYPTAVVIARKDFVENHKDIVKKFLKTHIEVMDTYSNNEDDLIKTINKQIMDITGSQLDSEVLEMAIPRIVMDINPNTQAIEVLGNTMYKYGFIDKNIEIESLYDFSILNEILTQMGREIVE